MRRHLSSAEIEQIRIGLKLREVKDLMKQNERTCSEAIHFPDVGRVKRSLKVTIPKEFSLSCPATPQRARSCASDAGSDCDDKEWSRSLRRPQPSSSREGTPSREHSRGRLTVAQGPYLRTAHRSRSSSRESRSQTPNTRSMLHKFPREQAAIERHVFRAASAMVTMSNAPSISCNVAPSASKGLRPPEGVDAEQWVHDASTAEERAQRARAVAESKREQAEETEKAKHCIFKSFVGRPGRILGPAVRPGERTHQETEQNTKQEEPSSELGAQSSEPLTEHTPRSWCE